MKFFNIILLMFLFLLGPIEYGETKYDDIKDVTSKTIIVDQSGQGQFQSVQQAIDSVPVNNNEWIHIRIKAGVYNEKVTIPRGKKFIFLEGDHASTTMIQAAEFGSSINSATFNVLADNIVVKHIAFKNSYNVLVPRINGKPITWAPAARLDGDSLSFYHCRFIGLQDTVSDLKGRHYFSGCYIQGAIDFVWGFAQSYFEKCILNATADASNSGTTITAQGRDSEADTSGFVFNECSVMGTRNGNAILGRAYRKYSTVIFHETYLSEVVNPKGWDPWGNEGKEYTITYVEDTCKGPGSDTSKRVAWMKKLSPEDLSKFINVEKFIDRYNWPMPQF